MNDFMDFAALGSFAGLVAATAALTQVLKKHFFTRADPKWVALGVAAALVLMVQVVAPMRATAQDIFAALANALLVAASAIGLYEGAHSVNGARGGGGH